MSKYIRTKDGKIINIGKYKIVKRMYYGVYYKNSDTELWRVINIEDIKAEADTIEELVDEYVVFNLNDEPRVFSSHFEAKNYHSNLGKTLYGAIWTDRGLIYVAKLNDKGELELL